MFENPKLEARLQKARKDCEALADKVITGSRCVRRETKPKKPVDDDCGEKADCLCHNCSSVKLEKAESRISKARNSLKKFLCKKDGDL